MSAALPTEAPAAARPEPIKAVPVRRTGQWVSAVVVVAVVAALIWSVATNENLQWSVVGDYLFDDSILRGAITTIQLTVLSMVIGVVLGVVLAVMRLSTNPVLSAVSGGYLWLFRGTPVLVQVVIWFNLALIFPTLGLGSFSVETNSVISTFGAALLALSLNEAAYMAEIVRGGILSVDHGQTEAAHALGPHRQPDDASHRASPGHAGHRPADGQRAGHDAQDHLSRGGDRRHRDVRRRPGHRCPRLHHVPDADGRLLLVPRDDLSAQLRPGQARAPLRPGQPPRHQSGPGSLQRLFGRLLPTRTATEGGSR